MLRFLKVTIRCRALEEAHPWVKTRGFSFRPVPRLGSEPTGPSLLRFQAFLFVGALVLSE